MEVVADLPADPQAAEPVQVRKGPLHRPAFGTESGAVLGATSGDDRLDSQVPGKAAVFVSVGPVAAGNALPGQDALAQKLGRRASQAPTPFNGLRLAASACIRGAGPSGPVERPERAPMDHVP